MSDQMKRSDKALIGNAAEHYVMAELLMLGIVAGLAPRNAPDFDIFAAQQSTGHTVRIRVKSKSAQYSDWQWAVKKDGETIFRNPSEKDDFVVLVNLKDASQKQRPDFYVVPTLKVDGWLKAAYDEWIKKPGRGGREHNRENPKRHLTCDEDCQDRLEDFRDAWDSLWGA